MHNETTWDNLELSINTWHFPSTSFREDVDLPLQKILPEKLKDVQQPLALGLNFWLVEVLLYVHRNLVLILFCKLSMDKE